MKVVGHEPQVPTSRKAPYALSVKASKWCLGKVGIDSYATDYTVLMLSKTTINVRLIVYLHYLRCNWPKIC